MERKSITNLLLRPDFWHFNSVLCMFHRPTSLYIADLTYAVVNMSEGDPGPTELQTRLVRSFLDITIMKILTEEPIWGYKMMEVLKERYGVKVGPPVIYPLLDSMEENGLIRAEEVLSGKRKRKVYSVLSKGSKMLDDMDRILRDF